MVERGEWHVSDIARNAFDLENKVIGTIGAGRIGYRVLQRLKPFDPKELLYYDYTPLPDGRIVFSLVLVTVFTFPKGLLRLSVISDVSIISRSLFPSVMSSLSIAPSTKAHVALSMLNSLGTSSPYVIH